MATETVKDNCNTSIDDEKNRYSSYSHSSPPKRPPPSVNMAGLIAQHITTAKAALEYYNNNKKNNVKFELVDPITSAGVLHGGLWYHCNFRAKPEGQDISLTKLFFAELKAKYDHKSGTVEYLCTACRPLARKTTEQCEICGDNLMLHPTTGFLQGRYQLKTRALRPRSGGKVVQVSKQEERAPFGPCYFPND